MVREELYVKLLVEAQSHAVGPSRNEKVVSPTFRRWPNPKRAGGGSTRPQTFASVKLLMSAWRPFPACDPPTDPRQAGSLVTTVDGA